MSCDDFPYGGDKNIDDLNSLSNYYTTQNWDAYKRKLSLKPKDILEDLNNALQDLFSNFSIQTLNTHKKAFSLLLIIVTAIGLLLLYTNRYVS